MHKSSECCEKSVGDIVARMALSVEGGILLPGSHKADPIRRRHEESESEELPFLSVGGKIGSTQKENTVLHGTFLMPDRILL